ncbi:MAG: c-type cytochrome [Flavobacterium sp.]|nr:MAG: c-type cytochrome [Flavobacterium sp.]
MKYFPLLFSILIFASCAKKSAEPKEQVNYESEAKSPIERGKELFDGTGNCFACHKEDQKIIAPSLQEIAKIYKQNHGDMVKFLKGNQDPIVDPSQYETMKTNFAITRNMSDDELQSLEAYIMSFSK